MFEKVSYIFGGAKLFIFWPSFFVCEFFLMVNLQY